MDTITLDINYTVKTYYHPDMDEEVMVVKTQFKPIKFHDFKPYDLIYAMANNIDMNIKEGDIPETPRVEEILIEIPSVTYWDEIPEYSHLIKNFKELLEVDLLNKCKRELELYMKTEFKIHDIKCEPIIKLIKDDQELS